MVITQNKYTQKGFAGIKDLLTRESTHGWRGDNNKGFLGYYRPLSLVSFAIEWQFFKGNPHIGHLINVLLFTLTVALIYNILNGHIFKNRPVSVAIALLFALHPIHTEVVANIKSRDEIMALLFSLIAFNYIFKYFDFVKKPNRMFMFLAAGSYFLALMSKENAITMLAVFPLGVYIFGKAKDEKNKYLSPKVKNIFVALIPIFAVSVLFLLIRFAVTKGGLTNPSNDLILNRFGNSDFNEKYATIGVILLHYLKLLFIPHPLSWDYSYPQIPFYTFKDGLPWLGYGIYAGILVVGIGALKKKNTWAFPLLFYLATLSLASGIIVDIGGFVGERFLYTPSLGWCMAMGMAIFLIPKPIFSWMIVMLICIPFAFKTIHRNTEWKDSETLFRADLDSAPNSTVVNASAASGYIKLARQTQNPDLKKKYFDKAIELNLKSHKLYDNYANPVIDLGFIYILLGDYEKAKEYLLRAKKIHYLHPTLNQQFAAIANKHLEWANQAYQTQRWEDYVKHSDEAARFAAYTKEGKLDPPYTPTDAEIYLKLAVWLVSQGRYEEAYDRLNKSLAASPNANTFFYVGELKLKQGDYSGSETYFKKGLSLNGGVAEAWYMYGIALFQQQKTNEAATAWRRALQIKPGMTEAQKALEKTENQSIK
jgi:tetratricopeptide (TPR) repeat protein